MTEVYKTLTLTTSSRGWQHCQFCSKLVFRAPNEFLRHLRELHCTQEGGSFVCLYGQNNVCASLPLEGVSDKDYEEHVIKHHASLMLPKGAHGAVGGRERGGSTGDEKWGVYSSTQNIPAVLNDPRKGMKRDFFTKVWGENFVEAKEIPPHSALPEVTSRHFEGYLRRLRKRQRLLNRIANKEAAKAEAYSGVWPNRAIAQDNFQTEDATIPPLFLSSSFNLQDPDIFYSVFTHITSSGISKKNSKLLQEKLFHILEMVEADMSQQIARKSSAFFDTMMYLNAQMDQLKLNHSAVLTLREGISQLKREVVTKPLKILSLPKKKTNMLAAMRKLEAMSTVREVQSTIQVMLARQEYISALDLLSTTQDLLSSELSSIKGLRHFSSELAEHEKLIDKMVTMKFNKYIAEDLNRPLTSPICLLDEDELIAVVFAVLRLNKFDFLDHLRGEINSAINATLKQAVAEAVSAVEVDQETTSVVDQAKALPIPHWLTLLGEVTSLLRRLIERVQALIQVMTQAVEAGAGRSQPNNEVVHAVSLVTLVSVDTSEPMLSDANCTKTLAGLQETLCGACDFAHDRCAKLLYARSRDQGLDKMSASEFLCLSRIIESFVEDTHKISGRKSSPFRMGLHGQATRFVGRFHEEREGRLKLNLSSERWKAVAIPSDLQALMDHITATGLLQYPPSQQENSASPLSQCFTPTEISHSTSSLTAINGVVADSNTPPNATTGKGGVTAWGEEYVIVGVCVVVVRLIVEYAVCALTLRLASQQLLTRLIDLLRKFNANTCRLLIEAGAVSLGLKTISTRHLALALRSLHLLLTLIPLLSHHFAVILELSPVEKHIEQLTREYREHCEAIEKKIVNVMSDSLEKHLYSWEARSPVPSLTFNGILKSLSKLHETISGILPTKQVELLFGRITEELKEKMNFHLKRLSVSPVGPQSWVVMSELTFYFNHISSLGLALPETQEEFLSQLWKKQGT